jgi:hypothetical protein
MTDQKPRRYVVKVRSIAINDYAKIYLHAYTAEDANFQGCLEFAHSSTTSRGGVVGQPLKHLYSVEPWREEVHGPWPYTGST